MKDYECGNIEIILFICNIFSLNTRFILIKTTSTPPHRISVGLIFWRYLRYTPYKVYDLKE